VCQLEYNFPGQDAIERKELDAKFHGLSPGTLTIGTTIQSFNVYITGDLAFYALVLGKGNLAFCTLVLGKPNSSSHWCIWCNSPKKWYGCPTLVANAMKWTCEKLKQAKMEEKKHVKKEESQVKHDTSHAECASLFLINYVDAFSTML